MVGGRFQVQGPTECRDVITALQRTDLENLTLVVVTDMSVFDPGLLQELDDALRANTSLYFVTLLSGEAGLASFVLERLHMLSNLQNLCLYLNGQSILSAAAGLVGLLDVHSSSSTSNLTSLRISHVNFHGDFALGWAALQRIITLEKVHFGCDFDEDNTNAMKEWLKNSKRDDLVVGFYNVDTINPIKPIKPIKPCSLVVQFYGCTFYDVTRGSVAGSIFVSTPKLSAMTFCDRPQRCLSTRNDIVGFLDFMNTVCAASNVGKCLPRLRLQLHHADSVRILSTLLPGFINLRHLEVRRHPCRPLPSEAHYQAAIDSLPAAGKRNGCLYRFTPVLAGSAFLKRNRKVPKMLAQARFDYDMKLQVPKLFVAAMRSKKVRATTILSAVKAWKGCAVLGPSDKAMAAADKLSRLQAFAASAAESANAAAQAVVALEEMAVAVMAEDAAVANYNAVAAGNTFSGSNFGLGAFVQWSLGMIRAIVGMVGPKDVGPGNNGDEINFWKREAAARKAKAVAAQKVVDAATLALAAIVAADEATQRAASAVLRAKKAAKKATTTESERSIGSRTRKRSM